MANNELSNVLRDIVSRAAKKPTGSESEIARLRKRHQNATGVKVALVDLSGSMASSIGSLGVKKIEHLRIAMKDLLTAHPDMIILGFGSYTKRINSVGALNENNLMGGTNLTAAIEEAALLRPSRTVIISDGLPDNESTAYDAIDNLTGQVDCVYCGPDGHPAVAYLASLSRRGGGNQMTFDGCRQLSPMIRGLLA